MLENASLRIIRLIRDRFRSEKERERGKEISKSLNLKLLVCLTISRGILYIYKKTVTCFSITRAYRISFLSYYTMYRIYSRIVPALYIVPSYV